MVLDEGGHRVDPRELRARLERALSRGDEDATLQLAPLEAAAPTERLAVPTPRSSRAYVPLEELEAPCTLHGLIAGNKETPTVFRLKSPVAEAALHTDRGKHYKEWNEDGAALFADGRGRLFVGVFDQAGGEGRDRSAHGAASALAAEIFYQEMRRVAETGGDHVEAEAALHRAVQRGHRELRARGRGEVTTFVGAMIDARQAVIVNAGDSGALHFGADGRLLAHTVPQAVGRLLLEGLGMLRKQDVEPETYRWPVSQKDLLVFGSDGLFDARLSREALGELLRGAASAADATRILRDVVRARMETREAKPDNLTALVVRVGDPR